MRPIQEYCKKNNITMKELAALPDFPFSLPRLYHIDSGYAKDVRLSNAEKAYEVTAKHLSTPLTMWDIINKKDYDNQKHQRHTA